MGIQAGFLVPHPPIVMPEVGRGEEQKISATIKSYRKIAESIGKLQPHTIILSSPHGSCYRDYFHIFPKERFTGDLAQFMAREVRVDQTVDTEMSQAISQQSQKMGIPAGGDGYRDLSNDHGAVIPLHFINQVYTAYQLVHISVSGLSAQKHFELGKVIQQVSNKSNKNIVFIASGDLSHRLTKDGPYGYIEEGPKFDKKIIEIIKSADFSRLFDISPSLINKAAECGYKPISVLAGVLHDLPISSQILSYEGPFGVGYAVASIMIK